MSDFEDFAERWITTFNAHDAERIASLWAPDAVFEAPGDVRLEGREACTDYVLAWLNAFPDARIVVHRRIDSDPYVVYQFTFEGTHEAALQGPTGDIPATGRRLAGRGMEIVRVENGVAAEASLYYDQVQLLTQLGLMPEPAHA